MAGEVPQKNRLKTFVLPYQREAGIGGNFVYLIVIVRLATNPGRYPVAEIYRPGNSLACRV